LPAVQACGPKEAAMDRSRRLAELIERGVRDSEVREAKGLWMADPTVAMANRL